MWIPKADNTKLDLQMWIPQNRYPKCASPRAGSEMQLAKCSQPRSRSLNVDTQKQIPKSRSPQQSLPKADLQTRWIPKADPQKRIFPKPDPPKMDPPTRIPESDPVWMRGGSLLQALDVEINPQQAAEHRGGAGPHQPCRKKQCRVTVSPVSPTSPRPRGLTSQHRVQQRPAPRQPRPRGQPGPQGQHRHAEQRQAQLKGLRAGARAGKSLPVAAPLAP